MDYDFDKRVACFGFGGIPQFPKLFNATVNHCFPLSGDLAHIEVVGGVTEILKVYAHSLRNVNFSGPTHFSTVISEALRVASLSAQKGSVVYSVLMILTDGEIHDM